MLRYEFSIDGYSEAVDLPDGADVAAELRLWIDRYLGALRLFEGDWPRDRTIWVDGYAWPLFRSTSHHCLECGEDVGDGGCSDHPNAMIESILGTEEQRDDARRIKETVAIDPDEPKCKRGHEHEWCAPLEVVGGIPENPGVWGHGGGVLIHEVCRHCGWYRTTDTWATRPDNGAQGLRSVEYAEPDDDSMEWIRNPVTRDYVVSLVGFVSAEDALEVSRSASTQPAALEATDGSFLAKFDSTIDDAGKVTHWADTAAGQLVEVEVDERTGLWRVVENPE